MIILEALVFLFIVKGYIDVSPIRAILVTIVSLVCVTKCGGIVLLDVELLDIFGFEGLTIWPFIFLRGEARTKTGRPSHLL